MMGLRVILLKNSYYIQKGIEDQITGHICWQTMTKLINSTELPLVYDDVGEAIKFLENFKDLERVNCDNSRTEGYFCVVLQYVGMGW